MASLHQWDRYFLLFKVLTKKKRIEEFNELCNLVCNHTVDDNTRSITSVRVTFEQCLLNFIIYMKHDNVVTHIWVFYVGMCRVPLYVMMPSSSFRASMVLLHMWYRGRDEIERRCMGVLNPQFPGCVGIIDDKLVEIFHLWNNPLQSKWFNVRESLCIARTTRLLFRMMACFFTWI